MITPAFAVDARFDDATLLLTISFFPPRRYDKMLAAFATRIAMRCRCLRYDIDDASYGAATRCLCCRRYQER